MGLNSYGRVGAGDRTNGTADAPRRIVHLRVEITAQGNVLGHREYFLRTGPHTQLAPFAVILVDDNAGHFYMPRFRVIDVGAGECVSHGFNSSRSSGRIG